MAQNTLEVDIFGLRQVTGGRSGSTPEIFAKRTESQKACQDRPATVQKRAENQKHFNRIQDP